MNKKIKIALVPGWSTELYHNKKEKQDIKKYWGENWIKKLENFGFELFFYDQAGFGNHKAEKTFYTLDDYVLDLKKYLEENNIKYLIAKSFGAAIATKLKAEFNLLEKIILISPAIIRQTANKEIQANKIKKFIPKQIIELARDFYLTNIVKNKYYTEADDFLRKTYREIVTIDLSKKILEIPEAERMFFFGDQDTATPYKLFKKKTEIEEGDNLFLFPGGHNFLRDFDGKNSDITTYAANLIKNFIENKYGK